MWSKYVLVDYLIYTAINNFCLRLKSLSFWVNLSDIKTQRDVLLSWKFSFDISLWKWHRTLW
jgi:hypothetical protein